MGITPLALAALALLRERPMHPYEMYQLLLERHEDEIVKVRPGSLYHCVERLHGDDLIAAVGTDRDGNRPERTTYAITPAGDVALQSRIREVLRDPVNDYPAFPVALGESHDVPAEQVVDDLRHHVAALEDHIARIDDIVGAAQDRDVAEAYLLAADYLRAVKVAQRDWMTQLAHRIETEDLPWPYQPL